MGVALANAGFDSFEPAPVQVRGASLADTTGAGRQTRMTAKQQKDYADGKEWGDDISEDEFLKRQKVVKEGIS